LTPIVYPVTIVPEAYRGLLAWNPMLPVISSYQRIVLDGAWPDWRQLLPMALVALLVSGLAWLSFRRLAPDLVDEL
jgi:lipopolysaccharide transport system permease protein